MVAGQVVRLKGADRAGSLAQAAMPSVAETVYLRRGLAQAGGKLPLISTANVDDTVGAALPDMGWPNRGRQCSARLAAAC
jgi:hypothetical protein